ncbi:hypothetical protein BCR33DRAFT_788315 [Rhizoclosmatium globosum]|uniref:Uncharacterized protein n=1 Tax=Rhizoclosmatium globosum TaxID=329046 RepID=A0A1Y2BYZ5_9FUNG|nr:hypothetical protein BCR33DRAFT_788315 [Rhizoclosmatium globosum]|eukprot:ORY39295.1 hypothetical protein BCR33DRAFT_788315 [Rhizoclosmatium globosum]
MQEDPSDNNPFHPCPNQSYLDFMLFVAANHGKSDIFWNRLLNFFKSHPTFIPTDTPPNIQHGFDTIGSDARFSQAGAFEETVIGTYENEEFKFQHRDSLDWILELIDEYYEEMLFHHNPKTVITDGIPERVFGDIDTSSWFEEQEASLPPGGKLLGIVFSHDKSRLDGLNKALVHPMYGGIMNIPRALRNKPESMKVIGYHVLWGKKLSTEERGSEACKQARRNSFHAADELMLATVKKYQRTGFKTMVNGKLEHFFPRFYGLVADLQEHWQAALMYGANGHCPCIECLVQKEYLSYTSFGEWVNNEEAEEKLDAYHGMLNEDYTLKKRTEDRMNEILNSNNIKRIKAVSLHTGTTNAFSGLIGAELFKAFPPDYALHHFAGLDEHIFELLLVFWKANYKGSVAQIKKTLENRYSECPRVSNFRMPTNPVVPGCALTAYERSNITNVLPLMVIGLLSEEHMKSFTAMIQPYLEIKAICALDEIPLSKINSLLQLAIDYGEGFFEMYKDLGKNLEYPKSHNLLHLPDRIIRDGSPKNYSAETSEHKHTESKVHYRGQSNKRDIDKQLSRNEARSTQLTAFIASLAEEEECSPVIIETGDRVIGQLHVIQVDHVVCKNGYTTSMTISESVNGNEYVQSILDGLQEAGKGEDETAQVFEALEKLLKDFVVLLNHSQDLLQKNCDSECPDDDTNVEDSGIEVGLKPLKYLRFHSQAIKAGSNSRLLSNPCFHGRPRYSNVMLEKSNITAGYLFGKVIAIISASRGVAAFGSVRLSNQISVIEIVVSVDWLPLTRLLFNFSRRFYRCRINMTTSLPLSFSKTNKAPDRSLYYSIGASASNSNLSSSSLSSNVVSFALVHVGSQFFANPVAMTVLQLHHFVRVLYKE